MSYIKELHGQCRLAVRKPYELQRSSFSLYKLIRKELGLDLVSFAQLLGIKRGALDYRERTKHRYYTGELVGLKQASGLSWQEIGELLEKAV